MLDAKKAGAGWIAKCPAHDDRGPSLSIGDGERGGVVLCCHAGCDTAAVVAARGLTMADLQPEQGSSASKIVATYPYCDEGGALLYEVVRMAPKSFRQRRPDGSGGWIWKLGDVRRVVYQLHKLRGCEAVVIVEGEKDADALWALDIPATTNSGGVGSGWRPDYTAQLKESGVTRVVIIPDNDEPGRAHAEKVAASCAGAGLAVKMLRLPDLPPKGDVSVYLASHGKDALATLLCSAPDWNADHLPTAEGTPRLIAEPYPAFAARLRDDVRPPDIVNDLIPGTGIAMLHGQPRGMKTWALLELARAVSTGDCAFGLDRLFVPAQFETWYITEEDGEIDTHGRIAALFTGREQQGPARLHVSIHNGVDFDNPRTQALMIEYAKDCRIRLTIADPIRSVSAAVDQGPRELKPLAQFLRRYARETGSVWILGHHDVKPLAGKADDRAKPHRASGGGIFSIADSPMHVERLGSIGSRSILTPALYKGSTTPEPVIVELTTDDPKRPTWARLQGETSTASGAEGLALHQQIREYLREHPATSGSAIAKAVQKGKAQTLSALEQLHGSGETTYIKRGQAQLWSMLSQESAA
jgi:putative DNA primase/helicase